MEMSRTAMFAGGDGKGPQCVEEDRAKICADIARLRQEGFDTFVVSYGSSYGSLALRELLRLKREGETFFLVAGKAQREPEILMKDSTRIVAEMEVCDVYIGSRFYREWLDRVIPQVTVLSHEEGLTSIDGVAPDWLVTYFEERDRCTDEGWALLNAARIWQRYEQV